MARYIRNTSSASAAKAGSGATGCPSGSRICRYWILNSATVRMRELCQGATPRAALRRAGISGPVTTGKVLLGLHLDEPARGAQVFQLQPLAVIQRRRCGG